jgi:hypothetical protein
MTAEVEKKAVDLGLLEEDDEFEEFPAKGKTRKLTNCISKNNLIVSHFDKFQNWIAKKKIKLTSMSGKIIGMMTQLRKIFQYNLGKLKLHFELSEHDRKRWKIAFFNAKIDFMSKLENLGDLFYIHSIEFLKKIELKLLKKIHIWRQF